MIGNTTTKTLYSWIEKVYLGIFALYMIKSTEYMTTFNLSPFIPVWADRFLLVSLITITGLKFFFLIASNPESRIKWVHLLLSALPVSIIWFLVYLNDRFLFLAYITVLILGCIGTDYRTILKVQFCVVGAVVFSAAICCMGGVIENRIFWGHETVRSSFGFTYPTNMAAYYVFLAVAAWIAWDDIWDPVFLLLGVVALFVSGVVADSKTSFLCSGLYCLGVLWCWLFRSKKENHIVLRIQKALEMLCRIVFPLCGIAAVVLTIAYHKGFPFALKINEWTSTRLALQSEAFYEHGIHMFGSPFPMRGYTSTLPTLDYNYIDCSYMQLLLRYGVLIFLVYIVLWPIMTDTAVKAGKFRLMIGLALIALHSLSEQRFLAVEYNILLVAPFSVLSLRFLPEYTHKNVNLQSEKQRLPWIAHAAASASFIIITVPVLLWWKPLLSGFRTLWTVLLSPNLTIQLYQRRSGFLASICLLVAGVIVFTLLYQIITAFLLQIKQKAWHAIILFFCLLLGGGVLIKGSSRLDRAMVENAEFLEEDAGVVALAEGIDDLKLYVVELPTLYNRRFGNISTNFFNGEDLARFKNLAVITDSDNQWPPMFWSGFCYTEISDQHAIYTDSPAMIDALKESGYSPVPYYSKIMTVNIEELAEWNRLKMDDDGNITVSCDRPIMNVPDLDLEAGRYTFHFDITLDPSSLPKTEPEKNSTAFLMRFSDNSGSRDLFEQTVTFNEFDDELHLDLYVTAVFYSKGVEFSIIPVPDCLITLRGVSYQITP